MHTKLRSFLICLYFCLHSSKFEEMPWTPGFSIKKVFFRCFVCRKKLKRGNNREPQKTFGNIIWRRSIVSRVGVSVEHCKRLDKGKLKMIMMIF